MRAPGTARTGSHNRGSSPSVCVLGAAGDTTNLGVDALLESTILGIRRSIPDTAITVFDNGLGRRTGQLSGPDGELEFERLGIRSSKRIHRSESLANMTLSARTGFPPNSGVRRLRSAAMVVDLSGGDSFSDIYGQRRFDAIARQKLVVIESGTPLVLLPQTYGPFSSDGNRKFASRLVRRAAVAWARDATSYEVLRSLVGDDFDEQRHQLGVDVAFALPSRRPGRLDDRVSSWLDAADSPVFGLNVSGLLANDDRSAQQFGLHDNYAVLMRRILRRLLDSTDARILLVPHVLSDLWVVESDVAACRRLERELARDHGDRIAVLEDVRRAQEVKWVIGRCDAFCGTRMHSTIAALSSRTPALALAYSPKTRGVFESCHQVHRVADLREHDADSIERHVMALWEERRAIAEELAVVMPPVERRASAPFEQSRRMVEAQR